MPHSWLKRHGLHASLGVMLPLSITLGAQQAKAAELAESQDHALQHDHTQDTFSHFARKVLHAYDQHDHNDQWEQNARDSFDQDTTWHASADQAMMGSSSEDPSWSNVARQPFDDSSWDTEARAELNCCETQWHNQAHQTFEQTVAQEDGWISSARESMTPNVSHDGMEYNLFNIETDLISAMFDSNAECYEIAEQQNIDYADYVTFAGDNPASDADQGHIQVEFVLNNDGSILG